MSDLLSGLLGVLLATNQPAAMSNLVQRQAGVTLSIPDPNDPVEQEYRKLLADDDAAQAEVDQWIKDKQKLAEQDAVVEDAVLNARIKQRLDKVRQAYLSFLQRNPNHVLARIAYGSFLNDLGEEESAREQWEKSTQLDPNSAAAWNNLANYHGHSGFVTNAFRYYEKAISLSPNESLYYHNFATTVYLFRHDATNYFGITVQQVFDKAMALYRKALELDSDNFLLATDYAQSYYGFKPPLTGDLEADRRATEKHFQEAMTAWQTALKLARDDIERQGVLIHFARLQINAARFEDARRNLNAVTNDMYNGTKQRLVKKLAAEEEKKRGAASQKPNAPETSALPANRVK